MLLEVTKSVYKNATRISFDGVRAKLIEDKNDTGSISYSVEWGTEEENTK